MLDKGKEAVFDLQDDLEDLLASGSTFSEISETLDVQLIKANKINRKGIDIKGKKINEFLDERILRTLFSQKLNEEGNIIDIDKDEGLAISIVKEIIEPREMNFEEAQNLVKNELLKSKKLKSAENKAAEIVKKVKNGTKFSQIAKKYSLDLKGVKPFTRVLPDSSVIPIPLISKIFDSKLGDLNFEKRGETEIIIAQTAEISNKTSSDITEVKEFANKIKDDLSLDLLAQFSEALRKKYKITINDSVIDQLN